MNKLKVSRYLLVIGVLSMLTVFVIISLQSYFSLVGQEVESVKNISLIPLDPKIRLEIVDAIKQRKEYRADVDTYWVDEQLVFEASSSSSVVEETE